MLKWVLVFTKVGVILVRHKVFNIQCSDAYDWGFVYKREGQWFGEQVASRPNTSRQCHSTTIFSEKLHVIFTYRHSCSKHGVHNFLSFVKQQVISTPAIFLNTYYCFLLFISCNLLHSDFKLGGPIFTHNLQEHWGCLNTRWDCLVQYRVPPG